MRQLLRRRGFRALLLGQGVSALGDWMGTVALMAFVLRVSDSTAAVGGVLVLRLLPAAVAGPVLARLARRWDRRRIMLGSDILRAGMISVVPIFPRLWWIYLWAVLIEIANLAFLPARDASVPDLVDQPDLPGANSLLLGSSYGTIPLGAAAFAVVAAVPAVGTGILGPDRYAIVFWVDAATYLVSFAFIRGIVELRRHRVVPTGTAGDSAGFARAFRIPLVQAVMPATAAVALGTGSLFSLGIVYIRDLLGASDAQFGVIIVLFGVGAAAGLGTLQRLGALESLATVQWAATAQGAVVAVMSLAPNLTWAFLGAAGFGAAAGCTLVAGMSILQTRLDEEDRLLAFAAFHVVVRAGLGLAALGAGLAADLIGAVRWPLVGRLEPVRVVLLCSGLLVVVTAATMIEGARRLAGETAQ